MLYSNLILVESLNCTYQYVGILFSFLCSLHFKYVILVVKHKKGRELYCNIVL